MKAKGQKPRQPGKQRFTPPEKEELSKQELAAKALKERIKAAEKNILKIHERYPEKSRIQLLRRVRLELGSFAGQLEIARIERNRGDRLSPEDRMFIEEEKLLLRKNQPAAGNCPCRS